MANKKDLKEVVRNYILENYSRLSEEDKDQDGIEDEVDAVVDEPEVDPVVDKPGDDKEDPLSGVNSVQAIKRLLDRTDTRLSTELRDITVASTKLKILDDIVDYVLGGFNTTADLPDATLRNHFIKKFGGRPELEVDDEMQEVSTTAGAPAPATKYAFKRKKK